LPNINISGKESKKTFHELCPKKFNKPCWNNAISFSMKKIKSCPRDGCSGDPAIRGGETRAAAAAAAPIHQ
jgi:hypothetical protein